MAELIGSTLNVSSKSGTIEDSNYRIENEDIISTNKQPYQGEVYNYSSINSVSEINSSVISGVGITTVNNDKRIQYPLVTTENGVTFAEAEPLTASKITNTVLIGYVLNGASLFSFMNKDKSDTVIALITLGMRKKPYDNFINRYVKGRTKFN